MCRVEREALDAEYAKSVQAVKEAAQARRVEEGKATGRGHTKVRQTIAEPLPKPDERKSADKVAKAAGTNRTYDAQAKALKDKDPALSSAGAFRWDAETCVVEQSLGVQESFFGAG